MRLPLLAACIAVAFASLSLSLPVAHAQGSRADYDRSAALRTTTANKVFHDRVEPHWLEGNTRFWYEVSTGPGTREYIFVDAEKGERRLAFDHEKLARALKAAGVKDAEPAKLALTDLDFSPGNILSFTTTGKRWRVALDNHEVLDQKELPKAAGGLAPADGPKRTSRDGPPNPLRFHNRTRREVEMFWLDHDGERVSYGRLAPGGSAEQGTYAGHVWLIVEVPTNRPLLVYEAVEGRHEFDITGPVESSKGTPPLPPRGRDRRRDSPDGKWNAAIKDHNVVLKEVATGREFALTTDGTPENAYRDEFAWSPDSQKLAGVRVEPGEEHKVAFVQSSPGDRVQPVLHTYNYYKPGDKLPHPRPVLWDIPAKRPIAIDDALFPNPFTETGELNPRWSRDSSRFVFRYNQRGHQVLRIIAIDATTGAASAMVDEQSPTFITYSSGKAYQQWLDDSNELIWMSERDGWNHLYLYDAATGRVKNQITRGEWVVRSVDYVDAKARQVWFQAGGLVPGQDPYYIQYCCVNFDGSGLVVLSEGDGTHGCTFSPDRRFVIDRYTRVDATGVTNLRRTDTGKLVCELERADASALFRTGWRAPERFVAKARDGETDIYGVIVRPSNFDPAKKYPVIEDIYAGPQGSFVPKAFNARPGMMELAELGFIVVQCDGMGTSNRSKKFHDVCWKNLGDAGLPDRVLWIKAAAAKYPEMDITRVGIYGTSAGGQNSLGAMLTHGDFYKVCVSDCGCHDNRMDKIWWNEQWMGWPVGPHYEAQSNVTMAKNLRGKLLLMVGEMDRNVDPASTMQVVNALIKANKDFDFVVVPGAGHGVAGTPYGKRRQQDFFVRHLLAREPRWTEAATN